MTEPAGQFESDASAAADIPEGAWAGLCLACGAVKPWNKLACAECGSPSNGSAELDQAFSEGFLFRASLEQLGAVVRTLRDAGVERNLRDCTLLCYLRNSLPSLFPLRIPRRTQEQVERLIETHRLPSIDVRTSAQIMPDDWDDHEAWDRYYSLWHEGGGEKVGSAEEGWLLMRFDWWLESLRGHGRRLWLPGCGLDALPWACAAAGFEVLATDASTVAIDIQRGGAYQERVRSRLSHLDPAIRERLERPESLALRFAVHDFRTPLGEGGFDALVNVQAFQVLSDRSMARAAHVHWAALRPGGYAYFSTLNVPRRRAVRIERVLRSAGFYIPYRGLDREEWRGVTSARSPAKVPLLRWLPRAIRDGPLAGPSQRWARRYADWLLRGLARDREISKPEVDWITRDGRTKIAEVGYNTG